MAVATTALLLLLFGAEDSGVAQQSPTPPSNSGATASLTGSPEPAPSTRPAEVVPAAAHEAQLAATRFWSGFIRYLPKFLVALGVMFIAWLLIRLLRPLLRRLLSHWERADATTAMIGVMVWILAVGVAVSIIVGDIRALIGSFGLVGLALSWALQTPIESFTGWLLNSFQGYYRIGDRIAVGEVFGDVYRIDFLTTTVWEIGSPGRAGFVRAEQPTGRLITFPNNEILSGSVVNLTRDFAFVWDELDVGVANNSDLRYAAEVIRTAATDVLGEYMKGPASAYERILQSARLARSVPTAPEVFLSTTDWSTNVTVRYLVGAHERRKWKSELILHLGEELRKPEHASKIVPVYPRRQIQLLDGEELPLSPPTSDSGV